MRGLVLVMSLFALAATVTKVTCMPYEELFWSKDFARGDVQAGQKCTGTPRRYNGKNCASTTHYADSRKGACGCGPDNNDNQVWWNHAKYAAAANQEFFDSSHKTWCGQRCGHCVKLTTTVNFSTKSGRNAVLFRFDAYGKTNKCSAPDKRGFVNGQGGATGEGQSHVFMITNDCPNEYPNLSWCNQVPGRDNQYGYRYHFDLENGAGQISHLGWNNPEVTFEEVSCDGHGSMTPTHQMYTSDCYCGKHGGKK